MFTGGNDAEFRTGVLVVCDRVSFELGLSGHQNEIVAKINELWDLEIEDVYGTQQQAGFLGTTELYAEIALRHYRVLYQKLLEIPPGTYPPCD